MNSRKANETLYQNTTVELSDEALANVVGGCGWSSGCEQPYQQNNNCGCDNQGNGRGRGGRRGHDGGLLGDLLCDLL